MKSIKNLVLSLLKILTPQDLERLSQEAKVSLDLAVGSQQVAEVSTSVKKKEKKKHLTIVEDQEAPDTVPAAGNNLEALGIMNHEKVKQLKKAEEEKIKNESPREEDIIIKERQKWKGSEDRLTKLSGFESYKRSAESRLLSTTSQDEQGRQKVKFSKTQGVLINKKQA